MREVQPSLKGCGKIESGLRAVSHPKARLDFSEYLFKSQ